MTMMLLALVLSAYTPGVLVDQPPLERHQASELHMGTQITIVLYATSSEAAITGFRAAFARIQQLDERLSDFRPDSELNRLSRSAPAGPSAPVQAVRVSTDLWEVLQHAQQLSQSTGGAFDITVGPLTQLWRRARRQQIMPDPQRLREAMAAVGYESVQLDAATRSATLLRPRMRLDLGAIAKGYAADEALEELRALGIDRALVNTGGGLAIGQAPPGAVGWKVGVAPLEAGKEPDQLLLLANCGIATSGDLWQYVEIEGRRYSHIVDPRTGLGLTDRSSVTVVAGRGMTADALATAVSVLGPEKGLELIAHTPGAEVLIVHLADGGVQSQQSPGFSRIPAVPRVRQVSSFGSEGSWLRLAPTPLKSQRRPSAVPSACASSDPEAPYDAGVKTRRTPFSAVNQCLARFNLVLAIAVERATSSVPDELAHWLAFRNCSLRPATNPSA